MDIECEEFIKSLKLLHSRSAEASDELKKVLEAHIARKNQDIRRPKDDLSAVFSSIQSLNQGFRKDEKKQKATEDDSEATDVEDNEMVEVNSCIICKQGDVRFLIECQGCKLYYHCDCHKPPIPKKDFNDIKTIWQCFKCKNNKKLQNKSNMSGRLLLNKGSPVNPYKSLSKEISQKLPRPTDSDIAKLSGPIKRPKMLPSNNSFKPVTASSTSTSTFTKNKTVNTSPNLLSPSTSSATSYTSSSTFPNLDKRLANIKKAKSAKFL